MAAIHFNAGICRAVYRVVIKRANSGIAPALHSIFWSLELWQIGTRIFATHVWHCSVFSGVANPIGKTNVVLSHHIFPSKFGNMRAGRNIFQQISIKFCERSRYRQIKRKKKNKLNVLFKMSFWEKHFAQAHTSKDVTPRRALLIKPKH